MYGVTKKCITVYMLEDEPRSGRPHTLSDDDRTELREHMEEHPGTSARHTAQLLGPSTMYTWTDNSPKVPRSKS